MTTKAQLEKKGYKVIFNMSGNVTVSKEQYTGTFSSVTAAKRSLLN